MVDIDRLIGFMAIMQVPFMNDPDALAYIEEVKTVLKQAKAQENEWVPFVKRQMTEEEQRNHPGWCFILDGKVPDDEQEILLYRPWRNKDGYIIEIDRYLDNGDTVYLEGAMDIENGMYWMPLPEPPKEETHNGTARND